MKEAALLHAGLSKNEAKVYLTLIRLGSSTAGIISGKSGVHRTNVYDALDRLVGKNLVTYIFKNNKKYFQAVDPKRILEILDENQKNFQKVLPSLELDYKLAQDKDKAYIYEGNNGIRTICNDIIREGAPVVAFGIPYDMAEKTRTFISQFHKKRIAKKISMKHLYDANAKERIAYLNTLPYTEAAYLQQDKDSPATTTVYSNKVAFYIWSDPVLSITIESERMAERYRTYFDFLWKLAKK